MEEDYDIIITDPPYNINYKNYFNYDDDLSDEDYIEMLSIFKNNPLVIIQYPEETMKYVVPALGVPNKVVAWCYNGHLKRRFRLISFYNVEVHFERIIQPYKNLNDKRIQNKLKSGRKGCPLYDWFSDIQQVKNVSKKKLIFLIKYQ